MNKPNSKAMVSLPSSVIVLMIVAALLLPVPFRHRVWRESPCLLTRCPIHHSTVADSTDPVEPLSRYIATRGILDLTHDTALISHLELCRELQIAPLDSSADLRALVFALYARTLEGGSLRGILASHTLELTDINNKTALALILAMLANEHLEHYRLRSDRPEDFLSDLNQDRIIIDNAVEASPAHPYVRTMSAAIHLERARFAIMAPTRDGAGKGLDAALVDLWTACGAIEDDSVVVSTQPSDSGLSARISRLVLTTPHSVGNRAAGSGTELRPTVRTLLLNFADYIDLRGYVERRDACLQCQTNPDSCELMLAMLHTVQPLDEHTAASEADATTLVNLVEHTALLALVKRDQLDTRRRLESSFQKLAEYIKSLHDARGQRRKAAAGYARYVCGQSPFLNHNPVAAQLCHKYLHQYR